MSPVSIVWSIQAAVSFLLAMMYGLVWAMDRKARASLAFAFECLGVVGTVVVDLGMMYATTPEEWGQWVRWAQVPVFVRIAALLAFIRLYFGTGRPWLMWTIIGMQVVQVVASFLIDPNLNFSRIDSIERIPFLGEQVTVAGQVVVGPHQWFAAVSANLVLVFVADASITLWRRRTGDARRKVIVIGGAVFLGWGVATALAQMVIFGIVRMPFVLSPPHLIVIGAMTFELSRDLLRASRLARELRESEARLRLAVSAARFGLWAWDVDQRQIWATSAARELLGLGNHEPIEVDRLRRALHPDDVEAVCRALRDVTAFGDEQELQFRVVRPDGTVRWIAALGGAEPDSQRRVSLVRGVVRDVTEQFRTRQEIVELQGELAHAGRVSMLGTLASSLAHELSQPLNAILLNAKAGERVLNQPIPDLNELREILGDIHSDGRRAAEVIAGLRSLLKKRHVDFAPVSVEALLKETFALLKPDAIARNVTLRFVSDVGVPNIRGDRVHMSQVLMNLIINGMEAVAGMPAGRREVSIRAYATERGWVEFVITDSGDGIRPDALEKIFEPFYTTKGTGIGLGLAVSRTIVEAHGGRMWAQNETGRGAILRVRVPAAE
jgi:PAS domain S-box-containing protein